MIFLSFKNPLNKKFFLNQNFDLCRRQLTLGTKKTFEVWFHNREAEGIFCRGLWGNFLKKSGSKGAESPFPPPKKRNKYILHWKYTVNLPNFGQFLTLTYFFACKEFF